MDERLQDAIAGAEAYESLHVPALFQEWTPRVLDAAQVGPGDRVLDIGCGTGVLARSAADRVGTSGHVVGVDPNPGMLAVAKGFDDRIEWRHGVAEELPCEDNAFECVVSQFAMMFFPDRAGAVREVNRVLVEGGRFAIAVWDSLENSPAYAAEVALLQRMAGDEAADALRAPFVLGEATALKELIEGTAGISVKTSTVVGHARFPSVRSMVEADLRGWLPVMGVDLEEDLILRILAAAEDELAEFVLPDGRMEFASPAHIVSGTAVSA